MEDEMLLLSLLLSVLLFLRVILVRRSCHVSHAMAGDTLEVSSGSQATGMRFACPSCDAMFTRVLLSDLCLSVKRSQMDHRWYVHEK